jgi:2-aminoethylphosphonate-pyruvate transaminase
MKTLKKIIKRNILFNPGPVTTSDTVKMALVIPDTCHREKEFSDVLNNVRNKILKIVNGEGTHSAVAFVSSATGCNEAVISSIRGKILLIANGKYSERLGKIIKNYEIPFVELKFNQNKEIDTRIIEEKLKECPDVTHIFMVHHETTTGMLAPLNKIGRLAKEYNKILCADTVSSFGGHKIDVKADNLAFCTVSANKCLESFPGVSFVVADISKLKEMEGKSRSFYFDLYRQWEYEEKGETPFTPAVQLFFALNKALDELLSEGIENRMERYGKNAKKMRAGFKNLGFEFILPDNLQSNMLTAIKLPKNMDYWKVHDLLKEKGYTIYSGKSTLEQGIFRIATMGNLKEKDIQNFLKDFKQILIKVNFQSKK